MKIRIIYQPKDKQLIEVVEVDGAELDWYKYNDSIIIHSAVEIE